jgi:hypothetical protein
MDVGEGYVLVWGLPKLLWTSTVDYSEAGFNFFIILIVILDVI